jgi:hypothetical protein
LFVECRQPPPVFGNQVGVCVFRGHFGTFDN